jgi:hypothetical protein
MPARSTSKAPRPSQAELDARARTLKPKPGVAEQFGITDDHPRETVTVRELPTPPETPPSREQHRTAAAPDLEAIMLTIFQEEAQEIETRLLRCGIRFTPLMQQDLVDHLFAVVAMQAQGHPTGGGALAQR